VRKPIVYDKAKYHDDSIAEEGLDARQAFVHTGVFLGWLIDRNLLSEEFWDNAGEEIEAFRQRRRTGPQIYEWNDGVLVDDMLNEEGNAFAQHYFDFDKGQYLADYEELLCAGLPSQYHVDDTWENYDKLKQRIDQRYEVWKSNKHKKRRWLFG
jgi:hypothetical protein